MAPYRLLIVDDEYNIREGIAAAIPWERHGIEVVGEAADGAEGLACFRTDRPDIVITDIQMDHMSGLDLAARLREDDPSVKIIIISGYDSFEYAQRALELRTFSYILKPVLPDELLEVVKRCIQEIEEERRIRSRIEAFDAVLEQSRAELTGGLLRDLLDGRIEDGEELERRGELLDLRLRGPAYLCLVFSLDGYGRLVRTESAKEVYRKTLGVQAIVANLLGGGRPAEVVPHDGGNIVALLDGEPGALCMARLEERIRRIQEGVRAHLGVTVTVGVSRACASPVELRRAFQEACRCLEYRLVVGRDSVITASDAAGMASSPHLYPADAEDRVMRCLAEEDAQGLAAAVQSFFGELERQQYAACDVASASSHLVAAAARRFSEWGFPLCDSAAKDLLDTYAMARRQDSIASLSEWLGGRLALALAELKDRRAQHVKSVVRKVQEFVLRNYTRPDLSLQLVAEHVSLSVSYLSKLYKRETDQSYVDYIVGLRIDDAKRRLRSTNARVADVGAAVGYTNPQYFCTLFRKTVGRTPAQYREHGNG